MRKLLLSAAILATALGMGAQDAAQWEQICELPTAQGFFVCQDGTLLASTYRRDGDGGIYVSTDRGESWTLNEDVADRDWYRFVQMGDDVYALGYNCYLARSTDNGKTWEAFDYYPDVQDYMPKGMREAGACYGAAKLGDRLYFADFTGLVFYSDDDCETFQIADRDGLLLEQDGSSWYDSIYNLEAFNGKLYAFGLYVVFVYDEAAGTWSWERNDSNCMSVSTSAHGKLITGRAMPNYDPNVPLLMTLDTEGTWGQLGNPDFTDDRNARCLTSDKDGRLFVGLSMGGFLMTPDMGETWQEFSDGIPTFAPYPGCYMVPTESGCDDDYLYTTFYWSDLANMQSGIYRYPLSALPDAPVAIQDVTTNAANGATAYYDLNGRQVTAPTQGVYIKRDASGTHKIAVK